MYRTVTKALKYCEHLLSSSRNNFPRLAQILNPQLERHSPEGVHVRADDIHVVLDTWLTAEKSETERSELFLVNLTMKLDQARRERDRRRDSLYDAAIILRNATEGAHGAGHSRLFVGLEPGLGALEPRLLLRHSSVAVVTVEDPEFDPPPVTLEGTELKFSDAASQIRPLRDALQAGLDLVDDRQRQVEEAIRLRDAALRRLRNVNTAVAKIYEAHFQLAGEDYHAERLRFRPSGRPSGGSQEPPPSVPAPEDVEEMTEDGEGRSEDELETREV